MKAEFRAQFTDDVFAQVADFVGADPSDLQNVGAFESMVHRLTRGEDTIYIKSTHSARRTVEQIRAELGFVQCLAEGGARVARPVPLTNNDVVASIPTTDGAFIVSAFEAAPGALLRKTWREPHFEGWGELLGSMHRLAAQNQARTFMADRPSWRDELEHLIDYARDDALRTRYAAMLDQLRSMPETPDVFGLIHSDPHHGNVHFEGTTPTAFDFDDCTGFWYVHDIAMVLYYTLGSTPLADRNEVCASRLAALQRGYAREFTLPDSAWKTIPLFLDLREAVLWLVIERSLDPETCRQATQVWVDTMLERILAGRPALDVHPDYSSGSSGSI